MSALRETTDIPDILVHAGFHKTGTTSLQNFLAQNQDQLQPYFHYYGKADFGGLGAKARRFGQRPFPWRLRRFRLALRAFLTTLPDDERIVLSRETFSGIMPGHRRLIRSVQTYADTAHALAKVIVAELRNRFGPDVKIAFLYTTREQRSWQRSVYGHLLRSIRLTSTFKEFSGLTQNAKLLDEVKTVEDAIKPTRVHHAALEKFGKSPFGPATAVLDIMGVPDSVRGNLGVAGVENIGDRLQLSEEFLALNRRYRNKRKLKAAKAKLLAAEGKSNG